MNTLDWLSRLVAFDTTSRHSNLELITALQDWFKQHNIPVRLTQDPSEPKANLVATLPAHDGTVTGGILLSGHTDVVPVDGQHWYTDPFEAVQIDDRVYGRGTCDMKGFLAVMLALVPEFQQQKLSQPVHFAFSYDEEIGCRGAPFLIADLQQAGIQPKACIVGEPTLMRPVIGHKGIQVFRCRVQGRAAHSSLTPEGCNAIEYAAKLMSYIRNLSEQIRRDGPFDKHYDVPFTSVSINRIEGGTANNIIPEHCEFIFEFRHLPGVKPETIFDTIKAHVDNELLPLMQREHAQAVIEFDRLGTAPSFEAEESSALYQLARQLSGENDIVKVAYATEAGLFQRANMSSIICGPGSIEQAHRPNEYVTVAQLKQCEAFLKKMVSA